MIKNFNDFNKFSTNEGLLDWIEKGLDKITKRTKKKQEEKKKAGPNGYEEIVNDEDNELVINLIDKLRNKSIDEIKDIVDIEFINTSTRSENIILVIDKVGISASKGTINKLSSFIQKKKDEKKLENDKKTKDSIKDKISKI